MPGVISWHIYSETLIGSKDKNDVNLKLVAIFVCIRLRLWYLDQRLV
jgi:hypothetical protein